MRRFIASILLVAACADDGTAPATESTGAGSSGETGIDIPMEPVCAQCMPGARVGTHGMALFGRENHFVGHIPIFAAPHNQQMIARVELADPDGSVLGDDFGESGFSLVPTMEFSLDDLGLGTVTQFTADVHEGNFEQGGERRHAGVTVSVLGVLVSRRLPGSAEIADGMQEHYLVGANNDAYLVNFIREDRAFQQILKLSAVEGLTLTPDIAPHVLTPSAGRLGPGSIEPTIADTPISATIAAEIWCLEGPDFFNPC